MQQQCGLPIVFLARVANILYEDREFSALRSLQRVCKECWAIATPLLYTRIRITKPSQWCKVLPETGEWYKEHPEAVARLAATFDHIKALEVDALPFENMAETAKIFATMTHEDTLFPNAKHLCITSRALNPPPLYEVIPRHLEQHLERVSLLLPWISPQYLCLQSPEGRSHHDHSPLPPSFTIPFPHLLSIDHHCPSPILQLPRLSTGTQLQVERIHFDPQAPQGRIDFSWVVENLKRRAAGITSRLRSFELMVELDNRFGGDDERQKQPRMELVDNTVFARGMEDDEYSRVLNQRLAYHVGELYHGQTGIQEEIEIVDNVKKVAALVIHPARSTIVCAICGCESLVGRSDILADTCSSYML